MLRKILLSSAVWVCLLMGAGSATAQTYTPPTVSVSDTTTVPGQTISILGSGFPANTAITITINPTLEATSDSSGSWSTTFTIPADFPLGTHTVIATGGGVTATTTFTQILPEEMEDEEAAQAVDLSAPAGVAGAEAPTGPTLPETGSGSSVLARVGIALLAAGGICVGLSRRRSHHLSRTAD